MRHLTILVLSLAPLLLGARAAPATPCSDSGHPAALPVEVLFDCNSNGVEDAVDIALGKSLDDNMNGVPDECEDDARRDARARWRGTPWWVE